MSKLLSINELNSYSRLVYNNNKSVLDAAFELLLDSNYSEKITSPIFKNQTAMFIIYIYSIVYFQLLSDSDNNMLYLSGNNNDLKLFAYNIIYLFDNLFDELNNTMDTQQYSIYSDTFNYIVSEYLSNCNSSGSGNINTYKKDITDFINNIYEYDYELIKSDNDIQPEDWEIYIYVICYNYICLFQNIQNDDFIPKYISNIKYYLSSCIIVYCMNIIIQDEDNLDDINDFLEENPYFSRIIDSVQAIFYENDDIRFNITNCPELFNVVDSNKEKLLETLFNDVIDYYTYKPSKFGEINEFTLYKFERHQYYLCQLLGIDVAFFEDQINEIKTLIRPNNRGSLKNFYQIFLNKVTIDSDKINLIKEKNIYLLNNNFEECFYSLILRYHEKNDDDDYKKRIIINLCDNINNINLNDTLNKKIYEITQRQRQRQRQRQSETLDEYFFNNFNIHFKLQQMENYQKSNYTETFCDAFYFPNNLLLQGIKYVNLDESNIHMGLFNLTEKNSPPIKLQTNVLFDTDPDNTYCKMNYNLKKTAIEFTN